MSEKTEMLAAATLIDARWNAVLARDPKADGTFFYSVKTTGIYCRPSCVARTPRPENVAFHTSAADAEQAGFRPCKRCRPDTPLKAARHTALMGELCRVIENADQTPCLEELARYAAMSASHVHRIFKAVTGVTPRAYAMAVRARRIRAELERSGTVTEALYNAGYASSGHFQETSHQVLGMTATDYRSGGAQIAIRFAVGQCSLGAILVAASERGVCAISLGDDPDVLAREFQDRFPQADLIGGDTGFETLVATVVAFVEAPGLGIDLPLDVRGTAFQQRVWQALREIPTGQTVSYAELAKRIGCPKSARAVARACAVNPLAVAIPCHRVVRRDGLLSGYRWGVERKRALLDREKNS